MVHGTVPVIWAVISGKDQKEELIMEKCRTQWMNSGLVSAVGKCETDENVVSALRKLLDLDDQQKLNISS